MTLRNAKGKSPKNQLFQQPLFKIKKPSAFWRRAELRVKPGIYFRREVLLPSESLDLLVDLEAPEDLLLPLLLLRADVPALELEGFDDLALSVL